LPSTYPTTPVLPDEPYFIVPVTARSYEFSATARCRRKPSFSGDKRARRVRRNRPVRAWPRRGYRLRGARTLISVGGSWVQAERGARPSQTPFLTGEQNEAYRAAEPKDDARFIGVFAHSLEHTGGFTPEEARRVAGTLLPDILRYDPARPAAFPQNGRALRDDAADTFLTIITNGKVTGDGIGPHGDLLAEFPYVGPPHNGSR